MATFNKLVDATLPIDPTSQEWRTQQSSQVPGLTPQTDLTKRKPKETAKDYQARLQQQQESN